MQLPRQSVRWLAVGASSLDLDRLETRDGRHLAGLLLVDELKVEFPTGVRTLGKRQVARVEIASQADPAPEP